MNLWQQYQQLSLAQSTRRHFLGTSVAGLGAFWLAQQESTAKANGRSELHSLDSAAARIPRAKHVIYMHMAGSPSQLELFDYKPALVKYDGDDCPQEYLAGKRFAFIRGTPKLLGPVFPFHQAGDSGTWVSDRLPQFEQVIDDVCFLKTLRTDQFNHAPAQLLLHTGNARLGYASIGSWVTYGLGSDNHNLPGFIVLVSGGKVPDAGKSVWGTGFLPSVYQGVQCRSVGEPVLYLNNPEGVSRQLRRQMIDAINTINQQSYAEWEDPETLTRISQYEMAFRMQLAASDATDLEKEPAHIHQLYGTNPGTESFANNCLLARRLVERGVRYVQLFDWGWDSHGASASEALNGGFQEKCRSIDQPLYALITDLKQRGLLEETLLVWSGEFGRTPMRENRGGKEMQLIGRDHHPEAFTAWMAGAGVPGGTSIGETDPIGYTAAERPIEVRDFHASILALLGIDHQRLNFPYRGLDEKLTGVKEATPVPL